MRTEIVFVVLPADRKDPAVTLDHDVPNVAGCRRNQGNPFAPFFDLLANPLSPGASLPRTSAGDISPCLPLTPGR